MVRYFDPYFHSGKPFQTAAIEVLELVAAYFVDQRRLEQQRRGPAIFEFYIGQWERSWPKWIIEFFCDLFAVYTLGPAYAWSHLQMQRDPNGAPQDLVFGVVFEIDKAEKMNLDQAEGLGRGYHERRLRLWTGTKSIVAYAYVADGSAIENGLAPYSWYADFVVCGANEHHLPDTYISALEPSKSRRTSIYDENQ